MFIRNTPILFRIKFKRECRKYKFKDVLHSIALNEQSRFSMKLFNTRIVEQVSLIEIDVYLLTMQKILIEKTFPSLTFNILT